MSRQAKAFAFVPTDAKEATFGLHYRLVEWAKQYLGDLKQCVFAYPHMASAGKPAAPPLRYHLLTEPVCKAVEANGVDTSFGATVRLSDAEPHKQKATPAVATLEEKAQYYSDLLADDCALLQRIIDKLGNEPTRKKQAVWRTFTEKLFPERSAASITSPQEYAMHCVFAWEELKATDSGFENELQGSWTVALKHLLEEKFIGDLKAPVGDVIAKDLAAVDTPQKLVDRICQVCKVVQANQEEFKFYNALTSGQSGSSGEKGVASEETRKQNGKRSREEKPSKTPQTAKEACKKYLHGRCTFGARCRFLHPAQPQAQQSTQQTLPGGNGKPQPSGKRTTPNLKLTNAPGEIVENGVTYLLAKDGKYYERSPCSFCLMPESLMGATKHTSQDCPVKSKCQDKAARNKAYRCKARAKP